MKTNTAPSLLSTIQFFNVRYIVYMIYKVKDAGKSRVKCTGVYYAILRLGLIKIHFCVIHFFTLVNLNFLALSHPSIAL